MLAWKRQKLKFESQMKAVVHKNPLLKEREMWFQLYSVHWCDINLQKLKAEDLREVTGSKTSKVSSRKVVINIGVEALKILRQTKSHKQYFD